MNNGSLVSLLQEGPLLPIRVRVYKLFAKHKHFKLDLSTASSLSHILTLEILTFLCFTATSALL